MLGSRAMKTTRHYATVLSATALLASGLMAQEKPALAFPAPSPAATVTQRVGLTDIEIKYSRPSAKGRVIFGGLVPWGQTWRTGANAATTITVSTDIKLNGQAVPAGTYSLFTIPDQKEWTVILNTNPEQFGTYGYDASTDLLRLKAKPVALAEPLETFRIAIDEIRGSSATLTLAWEKTLVPLQIETDVVKLLVPQIEAAMKGEGKKPYFQAAMFYYENGLDLKLASQWIDEAVKEQPDAVWIVYRKGLILKKTGDKPGALAAANKALELAGKAEGDLKTEYTRLSQELIASLN